MTFWTVSSSRVPPPPKVLSSGEYATDKPQGPFYPYPKGEGRRGFFPPTFPWPLPPDTLDPLIPSTGPTFPTGTLDKERTKRSAVRQGTFDWISNPVDYVAIMDERGNVLAEWMYRDKVTEASAGALLCTNTGTSTH